MTLLRLSHPLVAVPKALGSCRPASQDGATQLVDSQLVGSLDEAAVVDLPGLAAMVIQMRVAVDNRGLAVGRSKTVGPTNAVAADSLKERRDGFMVVLVRSF